MHQAQYDAACFSEKAQEHPPELLWWMLLRPADFSTLGRLSRLLLGSGPAACNMLLPCSQCDTMQASRTGGCCLTGACFNYGYEPQWQRQRQAGDCAPKCPQRCTGPIGPPGLCLYRYTDSFKKEAFPTRKACQIHCSLAIRWLMATIRKYYAAAGDSGGDGGGGGGGGDGGDGGVGSRTESRPQQAHEPAAGSGPAAASSGWRRERASWIQWNVAQLPVCPAACACARGCVPAHALRRLRGTGKGEESNAAATRVCAGLRGTSQPPTTQRGMRTIVPLETRNEGGLDDGRTRTSHVSEKRRPLPSKPASDWLAAPARTAEKRATEARRPKPAGAADAILSGFGGGREVSEGR